MLDWNDNHGVRSLKPDNAPVSTEQTFKKAFSTWMSTRKDVDRYTKDGGAYPIYIVAAQGGGIYAAKHGRPNTATGNAANRK